jgi:signal recognition particle GTPase
MKTLSKKEREQIEIFLKEVRAIKTKIDDDAKASVFVAEIDTILRESDVSLEIKRYILNMVAQLIEINQDLLETDEEVEDTKNNLN